MSLNRLGLRVTPAGHEFYVNTFVGFMLHILFTEMEASEVRLHISSFDFIRQQKAALVYSRSEDGTQYATELQLYVRTKRRAPNSEDMSKRFLTAINTYFIQ